jgi:hypothetical protein
MTSMNNATEVTSSERARAPRNPAATIASSEETRAPRSHADLILYVCMTAEY